MSDNLCAVSKQVTLTLATASVILSTLACSPPASVSNPTSSVTPLPISAIVKIGEQEILLEVARTETEQAQGLMHRTQLPPNQGMLFEFSEPRLARFWMKNTLIPLDMIFLESGTIQRIIPNVPPCKADPCPVYGSYRNVNQVLELNAGKAEALGLEVGQELRFLPISTSP